MHISSCHKGARLIEGDTSLSVDYASAKNN